MNTSRLKCMLLVCMVSCMLSLNAQRHIDNRLYLGVGLGKYLVNGFLKPFEFNQARSKSLDLNVRYKIFNYLTATAEYGYYRENNAMYQEPLYRSNMAKLKLNTSPTLDRHFFWEFGITGTYSRFSYSNYHTVYDGLNQPYTFRLGGNYETKAIGNTVSINVQFHRFLIKIEQEFGFLSNNSVEGMIPGYLEHSEDLYFDFDLEVYYMLFYDSKKAMYSGGKKVGHKETNFD